MGWFDEQVKNRKAADRVNFDEARSTVENALNTSLEKVKPVSFAELKKYLSMVTDRKTVLVILAVNLLFVLASCLTPILTLFVVDGGINIKIEIFFVLAAILELALSSLKIYVTRKNQIKKSAEIKESLAKKALGLSGDSLGSFSTADMAGRIDLSGELATACYSGVITAIGTGVLSLIYIIEIAYFGKNLALSGLAMAVLSLAFILPYVNAKRIMNHQALKYSAAEAAQSIDTISGIRKIRLAGSERRTYTKWGHIYAKIVGFDYAPPLIVKLIQVLMCFATITAMLVLYITAYKTSIDIPSFYAAFAAYGLLTAAYLDLTVASEAVALLDPVIQLIKPIVDAKEEANQDDTEVLDLTGNIEIQNVSFGYHKELPPILDNISISIKPGEFVAICGESGCGKSTLLKLLLGFISPDKGQILYDGKDISEYNIKSLRRSIGSVMQDGKIFHDDIRSNILISAPNLKDEDVIDALTKAQFTDDLTKMPMGLETYLSEGNGGLSGGQRQRLLIARAIVTKPSVLLLDEATSALDNITQKKLSRALDDLQSTRVVVAHRLSTIKNADKIILLSKGKIAETGTYNELIDKNGLFASLVQRQRLDL